MATSRLYEQKMFAFRLIQNGELDNFHELYLLNVIEPDGVMLKFACYVGHLGFVVYLIEGCKIIPLPSDLQQAGEEGNMDIVRYLLRYLPMTREIYFFALVTGSYDIANFAIALKSLPRDLLHQTYLDALYVINHLPQETRQETFVRAFLKSNAERVDVKSI